MEQKRKPGRPKGSKNKGSEIKREKDLDALLAKSRLKDEIWAIVILALGSFLVIALQTEAAGQFGRIISDLLKGMFALIAFALPYYLILYGLLLFLKRAAHISGRSILFLTLIFLMATVLNSARFLTPDSMGFSISFLRDSFDQGVLLKGGGAFGMTVGLLLQKTIGLPGLGILASVVILISTLLVINTPISQFFDQWKLKRAMAKEKALELETEPVPVQPLEKRQPAAGITAGQMKIIDYMKDEKLFDGEQKEDNRMGLEEASTSEPGKGLEPDGMPEKGHESHKKERIRISDKELESITIQTTDHFLSYQLPPTELLSKAVGSAKAEEGLTLKAKATKLEQTLLNFGVNAKVLQVTKGPAVTRYEIQPNVGVKVSSIVRLADDIALNLEARSIRIEAPIPGKAAVGIEVENERINLVVLREIIESREFREANSKIAFAVGKDISGNAIVANLKDMPHLLIAGSTGSGKSVCLNSLIISILYRAKPDEVKLVLIDPKVVELGYYNGIPHLLIPVVTEPTKAAAALNWAVAEMTDRYKKFAEIGVRDLESYNETVKSKGEPEKRLPQVVIIIDELADLMMVAPAQVEESICRLAQMARAAGMHLIVATQRPSVDVITGVIKANIPSRISFAVSSQFDSRTILDMGGAEKLVGKGDMLFNPLGMSKPIRVQGAFISDTEVHKVIEFLKNQAPDNEYSQEIISRIDKTYEAGTDDDSDELLQDAIETVVRAEQASVSMLQRRFRIGYNRAARLIDMLETRGIVGPSDGSRPRKVLMTEEQYISLGRDSSELDS